MTTTNHILIGHAYQTANNEVFPVNMQSRTLADFIKQSSEALANDAKHVVKWNIKKKIKTQDTL